MRIHVEARVLGDMTPTRFTLGRQTIEVTDVLDRWRGQNIDHFRVRGDDEHIYVLKRARTPGCDDAWEMVSYTHKDSRGTGPDVPDETTSLQ
jgi:hypothetical protein